MKKRILSVLLALAMLLSLLPATTPTANAATIASGNCGANLTWTLTSDGTLNISGTGDMTDYSYSGSPWYTYCDTIKKVVIGSSVTSIGDCAFYNCYYLTQATLGNSVSSIGDAAFSSCSSLTKITFGTSVTSIGNEAFCNCGSMTQLTLPSSLLSVGEFSFSGTGLTRITFPDSVTSIGAYACGCCYNLTQVTIGKNVSSIGMRAFSECYNLSAIQVVTNNPYFANDSYGVLFNKNHSTLIACPSGKVGSYTVPDSVTTIEPCAFYMGEITDVTIPNSVLSIGDAAFFYCKNLTQITISDSVASIGYEAFSNCTRLSHIYYSGSAEDWDDITIAPKNDPLLKANLHCHIHSYTSVVTAPTCTEPGYTTYTCACGDTYTDDEVDALGHDELSHEAKASTCTDIGWGAYVTCSRCDYSTYKEIAATGHDHKATVTEPTCTEKGYTTYTCACGDTYKADETDALGHDEVSHEAKTPTCTDIGWGAYVTCSRCDYSTYKEIAAAGHDHKATVTEPTCTEPGYTTYTCGCGDTYKADEVDALGHDEVAHEAKAPTCTEIGWGAYVTCSRCDYSTYEEIAATGHDHNATVTEPTCTEAGYTTYTCACGDTYTDDEVDALGHDWDEGKITTRPTSTTEGVMTYTCLRANCGETKTDTLPILDLPNPFVDVKPGDFYYDAVLWAVENGITTGTSGNKFSPDATCTRSQIVTFLWRAAGKPAPTNMECSFSDVNSNDYFYQAVLWAVENGITSGTGGSKFSPLAPCNRDQVVTFLWRAAGKPAPTNTDCSFTDVDPQGFYYDAMLWAVENGITSGTGGSKFSPSAPCSRGQIVTFLYRFDNID